MSAQFEISRTRGLPFPFKVMKQIFTQLSSIDRPSLVSCTLVSKSFSNISQPILFSKLTLSHSAIDLPSDSTTPKPKPKITKKQLRKMLGNIKNCHILPHQPDDYGCNFALDGSWIGHSSQNNLHTLRLSLARSELDYEPIFHSDSVQNKTNNKNKNKNKNKNTLYDNGNDNDCGTLQSIRPTRLIYLNASPLNIQQYPPGVPVGLYDSVQHLIFVCPSLPTRPIMCSSSFHIPNLKSITWIFQTLPGNGNRWLFGTLGISGETEAYFLASELQSLASVILGLQDDIEITIVNSGAVQDTGTTNIDASPALWDDNLSQNTFASALKLQIQLQAENQMDGDLLTIQKKADDKFDKIRFITMGEYVKSGDWEEVLNVEDVKPWLTTLAGKKYKVNNEN